MSDWDKLPEHAYYDVTIKYRYSGTRDMAGRIAQEVMGSIYQPYGAPPHAIHKISIDIKDPNEEG
jgi:hypothetical protein